MNFYIKKIKENITKNKTEDVLRELITLLIDVNNDKSNEAIVLLARYNQLRQNFILGVIDFDTNMRNSSLLNHALLMFIDDLQKHSDIVDKIIDKQKEDIDIIVNDNFFTVNLTSVTNSSKDIYTYPTDAFNNFQSLLNQIYFIIDDDIKPFSYGKEWIIIDEKNNSYIRHGRKANTEIGENNFLDERDLNSVGIISGSTLKVIKLK